jgi:predicted GNAT superfamily acetyltransferase
MHIRNVTPDDYARIIEVVDEWWGGRKMTSMLPKLFFVHFRDTSFIAELDGNAIGFLVGFLSPAVGEEAYIHFVGVHPDYRKKGVARGLYEQFFRIARRAGRQRVACVTAPVNTTSIAFHRSLDFVPSGNVHSGSEVPFYRDYDGPDEHRVLLVKQF